jgi:hypothetical protein
MTTITNSKSGLLRAQSTDKLYMENTLLRITGALFCHHARRAPSQVGEIAIARGMSERRLSIRPDPQLGQPGPLAHKIFVAILKKHSDYGRPIQSEVAFSKRELMRLAGRKDWGGADSEQLSRSLTQIQTTLVAANFRNSAGRDVEERFNIFSKTRIERREFASDPIEACTITLAEPIVASLREEHFTCLNHALMLRLGTIGQAFYMRLFFHFANRFDGYARKSLSFSKRYDDICTEWLGGLTIVRHRSKILERLGPHLDQLKAEGFLAAYNVEAAKTRQGFVLTFRPGETFFRDYDRFYRHRVQGELQWDFHAERQEIGDPLKVAYLFTEKLTGQPPGSIAFVPSKDVETAKQLIAALGLDDIPAFLDFALAEAHKTNFDIRTLGGTKQYMSAYMGLRQRRADKMVSEAARRDRERQEAKLQAYDMFRRAQAKDTLASLPVAEQQAIEAMARSHTAKFTGSLRDTMFEFAKVRLTVERHGGQLKTFEQWEADRHAA